MSYGTSPQMTMQGGGFQPPMPAQYAMPPLATPAANPVQSTRILYLAKFSPTLKTRDIQAIFSQWEDDKGGFKIKWIDDNSCYIVFADPHVAKRAFLTTLSDMPLALIEAPGEPERPTAILKPYTGEETPTILQSVQGRGRARSNASSTLHNRRTSVPNGTAPPNGRRESITGQQQEGGGAQVGEAGRRMIAGGLGRPYATLAGGAGAMVNGTADLLRTSESESFLFPRRPDRPTLSVDMATQTMDIRELWQASTAQVRATAAPGQSAGEALVIVREWLRQRREAAPPASLDLAVRQLLHLRMEATITSMALEELQSAFGEAKAIVDNRMIRYQIYKDENADREGDRIDEVDDMLTELHDLLNNLYTPIRALEARIPTLSGLWRQRFHTLLAAALPAHFGDVLRFYFRLHHEMTNHGEDPWAFQDGHALGIFERYEPLLYAMVYEEIEKHVRAVCKGSWTDPGFLEETRTWLEDTIGGFVIRIVRGGMEVGTDKALVQQLLKAAFLRFDYHIHQTLLDLRVEELFDIIVDYPDSKGALEDIHACLAKVEGRTTLARSLAQTNQRRLLHPGADTKDIIAHYVSTVRALRIIDPPGVLLSIVAEPVRTYLRAREDTIRCIMAALIDEHGELGGELDREPAAHEIEATGKDDEEDYRDPTLTWEPDPVDAPPDFRKSKGSDIVQMLISIYDTKDVFIKEFQILLAQRLLGIKDYEVTKEHRNVEILKRRFGEASLQNCEVMLKDLADSKRVDGNVKERQKGLVVQARAQDIVHATIVSKLFWPTLQSASFTVPPQLGGYLKAYERAFAKSKPDKLLRWMPQLGTVSLTVELADRTLEAQATPLQASLLELFGQKDTWTIAALRDQVEMTDTMAVRNALYYWANLGVVREYAGQWKLLENATKAAPQHVLAEEPTVESAHAQQVEQFRVYWSFVQGMLTNLGTLPLDRIHNMLSRFLPAYAGHTEAELAAFLAVMQQEGMLDAAPGNMYKLTDAGKAA